MTKAVTPRPIDTAPLMLCILLFHEYYSHGRWRIGYRNQRGYWMSVNACGTEGPLRFEPTGWLPLPGEDER